MSASAAGRDEGGCGLRVLVVEDDADTAVCMALLLRRDGHQVEVAHNGPVALRVAREGRPDVVFLDVDLPGMDGYEIAECLRDDGPVLVALTGFADDAHHQHSIRAGIDLYLVKPVDPDVLRGLLRRVGRAAAAAERVAV